MADKTLFLTLRKTAIKIGVVLIFRYNAGVVPCSKTELDQTSNLWMASYKYGSLADHPEPSALGMEIMECPSATCAQRLQDCN